MDKSNNEAIVEAGHSSVQCAKSTRRRDCVWSFLVCIASVLLLVTASSGTYSFGLLLPSLMEHFHASRQSTAWIGSLCMASGYFFSPLISYIVERLGFKLTAFLGSVLCVIAFSLSSFSTQLWMMYPTYGLLFGFGYRTMYSCAMLVALPNFKKWLTVVVGVLTSSTAVGIFVMTQVTQTLLDSFGWRGAIRGFAIIYLVCGLCSFVYPPKKSSDGEKDQLVAEVTKASEIPVLRNKAFLLLTASSSLIYFSFFVPTVHIVKHCEQELNIPGSKASMLFTYIAIASVFGRLFFCKLGDFKSLSRFRILQVSMTILGIGILTVPLATTFTGLVAIFVVYGLMEGGLNGQLSLLILDCVGQEKLTLAWGYILFTMGFSIGTGVPLAGLIADTLGSYNVAFYSAGGLIIVGASLMFFMPLVKEPNNDDEEQQKLDEKLLAVERITVI